MQPQITLPCPQVGHKRFEKSIGKIVLGDADSPEQVSKFIRPRLALNDDLGISYAPGELQKIDLAEGVGKFAYPRFIKSVFDSHKDLFSITQCRIYQFQTTLPSGAPFIFGLFITDGSHNLIDFCLDTKQADKRRLILHRIIRAICTPASVSRKFHH